MRDWKKMPATAGLTPLTGVTGEPASMLTFGPDSVSLQGVLWTGNGQPALADTAPQILHRAGRT